MAIQRNQFISFDPTDDPKSKLSKRELAAQRAARTMDWIKAHPLDAYDDSKLRYKGVSGVKISGRYNENKPDDFSRLNFIIPEAGTQHPSSLIDTGDVDTLPIFTLTDSSGNQQYVVNDKSFMDEYSHSYMSGRGRKKQLVMRYGSAPNMESGGEAKQFLVNNSQENSVSLSNRMDIKEQLVKAQDGMEASGNQLIQQLQQAVSQGATIEDLAPQVLQLTKGDPNMAIDLLVQAGFSKDQVSQQIDSIADQMEQQAMNQSQQGHPSPQGAPSPEVAQAQASPEAAMPTMNMGGAAKNREFDNPFVQMMQQGGKQDFDSIRKQMVKEYRKGGTAKEGMDTSSTEAYVGDMKNRLTANMFAGYAINKLGNDFKQMQEAATQSMKYGGSALPKAEPGIEIDELDVDPRLTGEHPGVEQGMSYDDYLVSQGHNVGFYPDNRIWDGEKWMTAESQEDFDKLHTYKNTKGDLQKKLEANGVTEEEYLADPELKKEIDATRIGSGSESTTVDRIKKARGYEGTEEQQKAEAERQMQVRAEENGITTTDDGLTNQQKSLSGDFDLTTAQFLTRPLTDIVQGAAGVRQAFGEKELTDQIQFKGKGSMAGMSREEMAKALETGTIKTGSIGDMYTRRDARRLARGKTNRGIFGGFEEINPYGKRVYFDQTPLDAANNVDPNNPAQVEQSNANAVDKENPEVAAARDAVDRQPLTRRQQKVMSDVDGIPNYPQAQVQASTQGYQQNDYQNEIDAQYDTALTNLKAQGIENPTKEQLNSAIDMVEQVRGLSGVAPGEMQPANWMDNYNQYVQKLGGLSPTQLFQMALGGLIVSEDQLKYDRPFMPFMKAGGVGGYKNEGYIDFEPVYESEVDFAQIADGTFQAASGVNELLENMNRYVSPEQQAANRNVNSIFNPRNRGSLVEGKFDMQTGQMAAQDAGDTIYAGQMGDRATRQRRGITNEFMAKYGLEVGQEVTLSQNELRALKSAGYILTPKK